MSWQVEGVWYHNSADYQRALAERDLRQARAEAESLRGDAARFRQRAAAVEGELCATNLSLARQEQLQAELQGHFHDLQRTQARMAEVQSRTEARMNRQFEDVRQHLSRTNENLDALTQAHQDHVRQVQAEFEDTRRHLEEGLAEAEHRRAETERLLRQDLQAVDDKVEADRRERLAKAASDQDRARLLLSEVDQRIGGVRARRDDLLLHGDLIDVETAARKAQQYLGVGDATQALVEANAADRALTRAEKELLRKDAELHAQRAWVTATAADLIAQMNRADAAGENDVKTFFPREAADAEKLLGDLRQRVPGSYARYDQLAFQRSQDERLLGDLDRVVRTMSVSAPLARELFYQRLEKVNGIMEMLRDRFGLESRIEPGLVDPQDPKSHQMVKCDFGGSKVDVYVPLEPDGKVQIEGYGHRTNAECQSAAVQVGQVVNEQVPLAKCHSDGRARTEPQIRPQAQATPWSGLADQLARVSVR